MWRRGRGASSRCTDAQSRKARNLAKNKYCVVCTEDAEEAVILEGVARKVPTSEIPQQAFVDYQAKYGWKLGSTAGSVLLEVRPRLVFAMPEKQFPQGVTRWNFAEPGLSISSPRNRRPGSRAPGRLRK